MSVYMSQANLKLCFVQSPEQSLVITPQGQPIIGYQLDMLRYNSCPSYLPIDKRVDNQNIKLYYRLLYPLSLKKMLDVERLEIQQVIVVLENIFKAVKEARDYLLYENNFILHPDTVFVDRETLEIGLVYCPVELEQEGSNIQAFCWAVHDILQEGEKTSCASLAKFWEVVELPECSVERLLTVLQELKYPYLAKLATGNREKPFRLLPPQEPVLQEVNTGDLSDDPGHALIHATVQAMGHKGLKTLAEQGERSLQPKTFFFLLVLQILLASLLLVVLRYFRFQVSGYVGLILVLTAVDFWVLRKTLQVGRE